jgi:acetyltransferase
MQENTIKAIHSFFHPSSIAILGASETTMYGRGILEYLQQLGYRGRIIPINPKREQILGIKAYPSVTKVPDPVDTALIIVDRKYVLNSLKECVEKGIKSSIIITAGFQEADDEGKELEVKLTKFANETGLRICGPNCAGLANIKDGIVISLLREEGRKLLGGNVGFVSQSGALMMALAGVARDKEIGLSYIASTGNECDLEVSDFIRYMIEDPSTKVITAFVEGFKDVHKFREVADLAIEKKKPIIVLKVGRSELGEHAAASHTGHLTGSDSAYNALFKQKGIVRAIDTDELFEMTKIFSAGKLPKGDGVVILTSSGGTGSMTADLCGDLGIPLPNVEGSTLDELLGLEGLLTFGKLANPVDIRGQGMGIIRQVLPPILKDENFSIILICLAFSTVGPGVAQKIAPDLIELSKTTDKPIVVLWVGRKKKEGISGLESGFEKLEQNGIPVFEKPLTCLRAIKALIDWNRFCASRKDVVRVEKTPSRVNQEDISRILGGKRGSLNEFESKKLISLYGIPIPREKLARSVEDAKKIGEQIGYPVVLKVMSHDIIHKTDAGIVALDVKDGVKLEARYHEILENAKKYNPKADIQGVLVQEMVKEGTEVIVGMSQDPQFGPVLMFGLGGTAVEVLNDVSFRVPPISRLDAEQMIKEVKAHKILEGIRGKKMADIESIIDIILKLSHLSLTLRDSVAELDINPLIVFEMGKGAKAVDALAVLK